MKGIETINNTLNQSSEIIKQNGELYNLFLYTFILLGLIVMVIGIKKVFIDNNDKTPGPVNSKIATSNQIQGVGSMIGGALLIALSYIIKAFGG